MLLTNQEGWGRRAKLTAYAVFWFFGAGVAPAEVHMLLMGTDASDRDREEDTRASRWPYFQKWPDPLDVVVGGW